MGKPTVDVFLDLVRRSGLVEKGQFDAALLKLADQPGGQFPTDTDAIADSLVRLELITRWQADRLLEGRHKGFFLGKYKLLDHLGTGGMSSVFLAEHVLMQRRVAIKVLPKDRVTDSSYLARFHREAQAAAALDHRNIVRAYDVDNEGNTHYLVMEYIEGRNLHYMVKEDGPLSYTVAAEYIRQAAEGLAHAHQAGLVHRDVKPANLLVDPKNVVKVLDLGLARFTEDGSTSLTVKFDENVLGTADYLAPEQALDSHGADSRADIYGLGCSLYYLLTGHPPFPDGTLPQRLVMHQRQTPPSIFLDRPDAPQELVDVCAKMMAKKPDQRYQSADEVAKVLTQWLLAQGQTVESGSGSGRLVAAMARQRAAQASNAPPVHRPRKARPLPPPSSGRGTRPAGMPPLPSRPPSASDTASNLNRQTVEMPVAVQRPRSGQAGPRPPAKRNLPKAQPLEVAPAPSPLLIPEDELPPVFLTSRQSRSKQVGLVAFFHGLEPLHKWLLLGAAGGCVALLLLTLWLLAR